MLISFVIPCYNSSETISPVVEEITAVMADSENSDYEIVLVNDCSTDNVFEVIKQLCAENSHIKALSLAKNFGQQAAIMAGIRYANGDIFVFMDDDGQNPAYEVTKMLSALGDDCDVVFARYEKKRHSLFKKFGSRINAIMAEALIGKPKGLFLSSYIVCKKFVVDEIQNYHNAYPYLAGLILRSCTRIKNVTVEHRVRTAGKSTYTLKKMIALWLNGFTSFSVKPLRIATLTGFIFAFMGFVYGVYIIFEKFLNPSTPIGYSSMMAVILFIGGILMLILGMIGEYIGRIFISLNNAPQYVIRETINIEGTKTID